MSPTETLTFACPACHHHLTVPVNLAGVVGPCPNCRTVIQAPLLPSGYRPPSAAAAPSIAPPPALAPVPAPIQPIPGPLPQREIVPQPASPIEATAPLSPPAADRGSYRPEPRQLPARPQGMEPIGKRPSESMRAGTYPAELQRRGRLLRILIPTAVLLFAAAIVFGIVHYLGQKPASPGPLNDPQGLPTFPPPSSGRIETPTKEMKPIKAEMPPPLSEPNESDPVVPPEPDSTSSAPSVSATPGLVSATPDLSSAPITKKESGVPPMQVLEKFLQAGSLAERMPLLETTVSPSELENSLLAKPLPRPLDVNISLETSNSLERAVDTFFRVVFVDGNHKNACDVLIRKRGTQDPKVVVNPFLDLFGGRLANFAAKPVEKPGTFHAFVTALYNCSDSKVPNAENKYTLKLTASIEGPAIAFAHIAHTSTIAENLKSDKPGLRWGSAKPCTLNLVWNTRENPDYPYLEASSIKAFNWNP
jgi:hypothetical protein